MAGAGHAVFDTVKNGLGEDGSFDGTFLVPSPKRQHATPGPEPNFWEPAVWPDSTKEFAAFNFCSVVANQFVRLFGEAQPNKSVKNKATGERRTQVNIPNGLFGKRVDLYKQLTQRNLIRDLSESTFYRWLGRYFWWVAWLKWSPFSKCDTCVDLKQRLFSAKAEQDANALLEVEAELGAHRVYHHLHRPQPLRLPRVPGTGQARPVPARDRRRDGLRQDLVSARHHQRHGL